MMKERPLLYSKEMVLSKLANRKYQTRRNKSLKTVNENPDRYQLIKFHDGEALFLDNEKSTSDSPCLYIRCPYGMPGDILWVQEDYSLEAINSVEYWCKYYADHSTLKVVLNPNEVEKLIQRKTPINKKTPGRFMYRSCSRFSQKIKNIRIEQVNSISEEDAIAEGIEVVSENPVMYKNYLEPGTSTDCAIASFVSLWESIYGLGSWIRNEWVWVIEFDD